MPLVVRPGGYTLRASFGGTHADEPSSDESPLTVTKQPTTLALSRRTRVAAPGAVGSIAATLQAGGEPLSERTVAFILDGPGGPASTTAITDFLGQRLRSPKVAAPGWDVHGQGLLQRDDPVPERQLRPSSTRRTSHRPTPRP